MPIRLPFSSLLVPVRQIGARLSASKLARYSAAIVFLPLKPAAADWAALPHGSVLRAVYARRVRKAGDSFLLRVGAHAETALLVACLSGAGKHLRAAAGSRQARAQPDRVRAAVAAAVAARLRSRCGRGSVGRRRCRARSGGVSLRHLQEQTEAAPAPRAHRYCRSRQAPGPRSHARVGRRKQYRPLAHRAAAERAGRRRLPAPDARISRSLSA